MYPLMSEFIPLTSESGTPESICNIALILP